MNEAADGMNARHEQGLGEAIASFGAAVSGQTEVHLVNLHLLRAIEETVSALVLMRDAAQHHCGVCHKLHQRVLELKHNGPLDPKRAFADKVTRALDGAQELVADLREGRQAALDDDDLKGTHGADVLAAYDEAIGAQEDLFECLNDLNVAVMEHDADVSPLSADFEREDDLIASLRK